MQKCECGKMHTSSVKKVISESGAIKHLPKEIKLLGGKKPFVLTDKNIFNATNEKFLSIMKQANIPFTLLVRKEDRPTPDNATVGSVLMNYDDSCDIIVGIGSGVINDICKIISCRTKLPYIIVASAPSMDGYASATSSMELDGLKVSLPTRCPDIIIGDIDILKNAPEKSLIAGLGDMLAKYISICEWRLSNLITGEYYCENVANLVRTALKNCVDNASGLLKREPVAVKSVFDGLVLSGKTMEFAGLSRPASGTEHSMSHIWDMRSLSFGTASDLHGVQCALCTLYTLKAYDILRGIPFDKDKAINYAKNFDLQEWNRQLLSFVGNGANAMIALDEKEKKYDLKKHEMRLKKIINSKDTILRIIKEELPPTEWLHNLLISLNLPTSSKDIGIKEELVPMTFKTAKDLRDKYILPRFCWDLGILDEVADSLI